MKIAFLLGSSEISGGTIVILEHATRLHLLGHEVDLVFEESVAEHKIAWHPQAILLPRKTLEQATAESYDLVLATWWRTAYSLYRMQAKIYAYFVQSIESRFYSEQHDIVRTAVDRTYRFPCRFVTEATWIQRHLSEHFGVDADLVRNGIRKDLFTLTGPSIKPRLCTGIRILVEGPLNVPFKNVEKTLALCQKADVGEVWLLTSSSAEQVPGADRVFSCLPISQTPLVYRSCDILVKLSYVEGMFGPPLEMFHCGGTAIVYDVTGSDEYIRHNENALVIPRDDEEAVVYSIRELQRNSESLNKLKKGAIETAIAWPDWNSQSAILEGVFAKWASSVVESNVACDAKSLLLEATEAAISMSGGVIHQLPQTSEMQVRACMRRMAAETCMERDVIIFGTGVCAQHVLKYLDLQVFRLIGYFDNNPDRIGSPIDGIPVYAPHRIPDAKVIIASMWTSEIRDQLLRLGYDPDHIICIYPE